MFKGGNNVIHVLVTGILLGFASGITPGPLQALVISQSVQFGWRRGVLVSLAPLVTDAFIVSATIWMFSHVPAWVLHGMTVIGAVMVAFIALDTWRAAQALLKDAHQPEATDSRTLEAGTRSATTRDSKGLWHATLVNLLNPHAWLFWVVVGSPITVRYARTSVWQAVVFILCFYSLLVGIKIVLSIGIDRGVSWTGGKGRVWILRGTALALVLLAVVMGITGFVNLLSAK